MLKGKNVSETTYVNLKIEDQFVASMVDKRSVDLDRGPAHNDVRTVLIMADQLVASQHSAGVKEIRETLTIERNKSRSDSPGKKAKNIPAEATNIRLKCQNDIGLGFVELIQEFDARAIAAKSKFLEGYLNKQQLQIELKAAARPIRRCIDTIVKVSSALDRVRKG